MNKSNGRPPQNTSMFATSSWGNFSSRYDRQPNYKNTSNSNAADSESNLNEQNDNAIVASSTPQYQSNCDISDVNDFQDSTGGGNGDSFDNNKQSNFNNYGPPSGSYGNQRGNSNNNGYQQNFKGLASQRDQFVSNFLGSLQNQSNFNSFGSNASNFGSRQFQSNSNNRGGSYGNNSNRNFFPNSDQQNQSLNESNGGNNNSNSNYVPFRKFRQHFANRQNGPSNDNSPAPSLFMGRDESYPEELNNLINPFFCGVCNSRLNSIKSANIHYESKAHDKQISNWMKKTYAEKGLSVPEIKRFVTEDSIGPYRCELCKVDLTSAQHALQHYNGKRHRQAATKISPPTGIGYYNVDGNWVETGKVLDKVTGKETSYILVNTPTGFEPVVLHVAPTTGAGIKRPAESKTTNPDEKPAKQPNLGEPHDAEKEKIKKTKEEQYRTMVTEYEKKKQQPNATNPTTANNQFKAISLDSQESSHTGQTPQEALNSQQCNICGIATTSYDQMLLHLKGIRHTKKLRALGEPPISDLFDKSSNTILESLDNNHPSDVSMYRTPSGSYYCKTCNASMEDVARIKKHILSKDHLALVKQSGGKQPKK